MPAIEVYRSLVAVFAHVRSPLIALVSAASVATSAWAAGPLPHDDVAWMQRAGFGIDSAAAARYRELGRLRYLDAELADRGEDALPLPVAGLIHAYEAIDTPASQLVAQLDNEQQRLRSMTDGNDKTAAKKALQRHGRDLVEQAQQAVLLRAIYGSNPLKEQLVWFWLNHFSVHALKKRVRWVAADYEENTIRPHALGKFRDIVMATLKSPAMLEYLDNAQNAKDKINENYARELLELHTLGVGSGYSQGDVQQLARILTGVGLVPASERARQRASGRQSLVVRDGLFEFNPARHDFGDKTLLGQRIKGSGFHEVEQAVDLIVRQPACAAFVSRQLAEYFVADQPPPSLVAKMARTFLRSDGNIADVMRVMFTSKELSASYGKKFKDPMQFVVSSVHLAYDGKPIVNPARVAGWLRQLGEPVFGRSTPDGWPLDAAGWSSSGQMARRFEIARAIGAGNNALFTPAGGDRVDTGPPRLTTPIYHDAIEPRLMAATRAALDKAGSQQEWNTYFLSSPDFNYR